ncbi:hypothetical protein BJ971_005885 [Actinoplanes digitatis]|uniref:Uncharacterized protein n=1 Tax=Actinoplanes digitatis TaxID=1868 RepID=A0A7W7I2N4_9ACTN|nr:hypothetical protein [Actinoplanes digitatis]
MTKLSLPAHLPAADPDRVVRQQRVAVGPAMHPPVP